MFELATGIRMNCIPHSAGPVGGIALFADVSGGKACVAAQEFQAKRCSGVEFGESLFVNEDLVGPTGWCSRWICTRAVAMCVGAAGQLLHGAHCMALIMR